MLELIRIRKDYGDRTMLNAVSLKIGSEPGQKVGLVGLNGCGKSTLLKILAGCVAPDGGSLRHHGNIKIGYLAQSCDEVDAVTVRQLLAPEASAAIETMKRLETEMMEKENHSYLLDLYSQSVESFELAGGYQLEARMESTLAGLGMPEIDLDRPLTTLSGGQRTRLALARVLLLDADILLLDEPTNNLDLPALEWLEAAMIESSAACVVVSHDRRFLDRVTTRTLELSSASITEYGGNYSWYQKRKSEDEARQWREYEEQQIRIKQLQQNIRDHKQKALKTENSTVHDFYRGRSKKVAATAKARETRLSKILADEQRKEKPRPIETMRLALKGNTMHGGILLSIEDGLLKRGETTILKSLNLEIHGGKKIAITGGNGSGKSSLLELIAAYVFNSASNHSVENAVAGIPVLAHGELKRRSDLSLGYLSQNQETLPEESSVLEYFIDRALENGASKFRDESASRTFLHRFLFSRDEVFKKIGKLSRGERTKLILATFMAAEHDLLMLDEPTNHLDLATLECLEAALSAYKAALLVVTHDRFFLDKIEPDLILNIAHGELAESRPEARTA